MRRVLIAAYHFPPSAWGASQRPALWARHLPLHGWDPVVLTVGARYHASRDESLLRNVPCRVERTPLASLPLVGDEGIRWLPHLLRAARRLARRPGVDVLLLTGTPFFSFLAGPLIEALEDVPYVLDFRDPWTIGNWWPDPPGLKSDLKAAAGRLCESVSVRSAALCTFAQPGVMSNYRRTYEVLRGARSAFLPNGYDEDDFPEAGSPPPPPPRRERFLLVHAGTWGPERSPDGILRALAGIKERRGGRLPLEARFVGHSSLDAEAAVEEMGLHGDVRFEPYLPHQDCVRLIREADALWLDNLAPREYVAGKVFEYMASGRPILAAAHRAGPVARWLRAAGTATLVGREPALIQAGLETLLEDLEAGRRPVPAGEPVRRFGRSRSAALLASLLDRIAPGSARLA